MSVGVVAALDVYRSSGNVGSNSYYLSCHDESNVERSYGPRGPDCRTGK